MFAQSFSIFTRSASLHLSAKISALYGKNLISAQSRKLQKRLLELAVVVMKRRFDETIENACGRDLRAEKADAKFLNDFRTENMGCRTALADVYAVDLAIIRSNVAFCIGQVNIFAIENCAFTFIAVA